MLIWFCITDEARQKLMKLASKSWRPPREDWGVKTDFQLEGIEEIGKLIRQRPHHQARLGK